MDDEFRKDVAGIGRDEMMSGLDMISIDDPPSHGWLRRSEFDRPGIVAWERPDGSIVGVPEAT